MEKKQNENIDQPKRKIQDDGKGSLEPVSTGNVERPGKNQRKVSGSSRSSSKDAQSGISNDGKRRKVGRGGRDIPSTVDNATTGEVGSVNISADERQPDSELGERYERPDTGQVSLETTKEVIRTIRAGTIEKIQSIRAVQKQAEEIALNQAIE